MILTKEITLKVSKKNIEHFKFLGYNFNLKDIVTIPTEHLNKGTHIRIDVQCDICNKKKNIMYQKYIKNINNGKYYACSSKCAQDKVKQTSLNKFGNEYYTQTKECKEKIEKMNFELYGVKYHTQLESIKNKIKQTNLEKYGCENVFQNENIKKKSRQTCLEKYGVENVNYDYKISKKRTINSLQTKNINFIKKYNVLKCENGIVEMNCDLGLNHTFEIEKKLFFNRRYIKTTLCTICHPLNSHNASGLEIELRTFLENYIEIIPNNKKIIGQDIDIYVPELKLAFEFNGTYWHNELNKPKNYHKDKTELCEKQGIQLIHIFQDDWLYKQNIVKSKILNLLGKSNKIYARKCIMKEVNSKESKLFLEQNHIQGNVNAKHNIGLYYESELVSLMTFGKKRKFMNSKSNENEYEMLRFCSKLNYTVIGGASKLFNYFVKIYNPDEIVSYADRSWSKGNLYEQLGFKFINKTIPNYFYVIDGIRKHRYGFRKDILIKQGFDKNKTEHEIMLDRDIYRIYDSGHLKFIWKK